MMARVFFGGVLLGAICGCLLLIALVMSWGGWYEYYMDQHCTNMNAFYAAGWEPVPGSGPCLVRRPRLRFGR